MSKIKHVLLVILPVFILIMSTQLKVQTNDDFYSTSVPETNNKIAYTPYGKLQLIGNSGLLSFVAAESLLGNGSENNPYVIKGYQFTGYGSDYAVVFESVDLHFLLTDCEINGGYPDGIQLTYTENGQIVNNSIDSNSNGIVAQESSNIMIRNNSITYNTYYGVNILDSTRITVNENGFFNNGEGISLTSSNETIVEGNEFDYDSGTAITISRNINGTFLNNIIKNCNTGFYVSDSYNISITSNEIISNIHGVDFRSGMNASVLSYNEISSSKEDGINLYGNSEDLVIKNNLIGFGDEYGIKMMFASSVKIIDNNITSNQEEGIYIYQSSGYEFSGNLVSKNGKNGFHFRSSTEGYITNNSISANEGYGIFLENSPDHHIQDNILANQDSLYLYGSVIGDYHQGNVTGNLVNGRSLVFWEDVNDQIIAGDAGQIILINCSSVSVSNQDLSEIEIGIAAFFSNDVTIQDCTFENNAETGILFNQTWNSLIEGNSFRDNSGQGLWLISSPKNTIKDNTFTRNGLILTGSTLKELYQHSVSGNTVNGRSLIVLQNQTGNTVQKTAGQVILINCNSTKINGVTIQESDIGIATFFSHNTEINENTISDNRKQGIILYHSTNSKISHNIIKNNIDYGIYLAENSSDNTIEFNDFVGNRAEYFIPYSVSFSPMSPYYFFSQAWDSSELNIFSHNYWNGWVTPDFDMDGIVDEPYYIYGGKYDQYPQVYPNVLPQIVPPTILNPQGGNVSGVITITWEEPSGISDENIYYDLYYSDNDGQNWIVLEFALEDTTYQWNTTSVVDGAQYRLMLRIYTANRYYYTVTSEAFRISNLEETTKSSASFPNLVIAIFGIMVTIFLSRRKRKGRE